MTMTESTVSRQLDRDPKITPMGIGWGASPTGGSLASATGMGEFLVPTTTTLYQGHAYAITPNSGCPYLVAIVPATDLHTLKCIMWDGDESQFLDSWTGDGVPATPSGTTFTGGWVALYKFQPSTTASHIPTQDFAGQTVYFETGEYISIIQATNYPVAGTLVSMDLDGGCWVDMCQPY